MGSRSSSLEVLQTVDDSFTEEQLTILLGPSTRCSAPHHAAPYPKPLTMQHGLARLRNALRGTSQQHISDRCTSP